VYRHDPVGIAIFFRLRNSGVDCIEDLASPGVFEWEILTDPAVLVFSFANIRKV
jgi:hypothetical protein